MIVKSFVIGMKVRWWRCSIRKFLEGKMGMDRISIGILDCFFDYHVYRCECCRAIC